MKQIASGFLRMMDHQGIDPVQYIWVTAMYDLDSSEKQEARIQENSTILNYLNKKIRLEFTGKIRCVSCGRITKKSFNQGNCFTCFQTLAENDLCILRPDTCHFHLGTCREPDWGESHCFISHTVYLANSSAIKVGITKENPVSNRWVDQGAVQGIPLVEVVSRRDAGIIEKELSKVLSDRTTWQKMVAGDPEPVDLIERKKNSSKKSKSLILIWIIRFLPKKLRLISVIRFGLIRKKYNRSRLKKIHSSKTFSQESKDSIFCFNRA